MQLEYRLRYLHMISKSVISPTKYNKGSTTTNIQGAENVLGLL